MPKPTILIVESQPDAREALRRDIAARYGERYEVRAAATGEDGVDTYDEARQRGETVALILADHDLQGLCADELFTRVRHRSHLPRRVLLVAYDAADAAVEALNADAIDFYLVKPLSDAECDLYPVLDDLLAAWTADHERWKASNSPDYDGVRVVGHRWSQAAHEIKDLLARNQVPYRWVDIDREPAEAARLLEPSGPAAGSGQPALPLVHLPNGRTLVAPSLEELSSEVGLHARAEQRFYDLVIVGGGPTGLAAAVYGASEGLTTMMLDKQAPGGQAGTSSLIENYLGFPNGLSGADLARRAVEQARRFGVEIVAPQSATSLRVRGGVRRVTLGDGSEIGCHAVLVATGVAYKRLEVDGAERFEGAGVYYGAAITEAVACDDQEVFIVGGANSAGQAAVYLSRYARKVGIVVRGDSLDKSMSRYLVDHIQQTRNIEVLTDTQLRQVCGESCVEAVRLENTARGESYDCPAAAVFVFIGAEPHTEWLGEQVCRDEHGFILTGPDLFDSDEERGRSWPLKRDPYLLETSVPGVFAAGDVRHGAVRRVAAGVGAGSMAVQFIHEYLAGVK